MYHKVRLYKRTYGNMPFAGKLLHSGNICTGMQHGIMETLESRNIDRAMFLISASIQNYAALR